MAKKKLTHQSKQEETHPQPTKPQQHLAPSQPFTMDNNSEKLQSLKNLNSMLLKETSQRRQQVESLVEAKESLESMVSAASDDNVVLEIEKAVTLVVVEAHVREMGLRFEGLERAAKQSGSRVGLLEEERDRLKRDLDAAVEDANELKVKVVEKERMEREIREEVQKLRLEREKLLEEVSVNERAIEEAVVERDFALRDSAETARVIDELRGEIEVVTREKSEILEQKNGHEVKIAGLELELKELDESLCDSRKEAAAMREEVFRLEGTLGLAAEKEEAMVLEKEEMEKSVEMLREGRDGLQKALGVVQRELEDKRREIDERVREKNEIELVKVEHEGEIVELQRELDALRDVVHKLKESCRDFQEKNKHLVSEVDNYRKSIQEVILDKDNIRKGFDEEKDKAKSLALLVAGMEDKIKKMAIELEQVRSNREKLVEKNEIMESSVGNLMNEKDALQRSLLEAQQESENLRAKVEFSCNNSSRALALLMSTATLVSQNNDSMGEALSDKPEVEEEVQPYAEQLGAIKNAFRGKNKMVADMKKQLELMQNSVASANKMKSFWTVISSATTIFAAALAVYVVKG